MTDPIRPDQPMLWSRVSLAYIDNYVSMIEDRIKARALAIAGRDGRTLVARVDAERAAEEVIRGLSCGEE